MPCFCVIIKAKLKILTNERKNFSGNYFIILAFTIGLFVAAYSKSKGNVAPVSGSGTKQDLESSKKEIADSSATIDNVTENLAENNKQEEKNNKPKEEVKSIANAPAPVAPSREMIKCKMKFDDDNEDLNIDKVFVEWSCSNYTGWTCKLTDDYGGKQPKAPIALPSGKTKMFCWWPTGEDTYAVS